jgi:hypothetical protein
MCLKCLRFTRRRAINTWPEMCALAERIRSAISTGTLELIESNRPLEEIRPESPDIYKYFVALRCPRCRREFQLSGDLYYNPCTWR